MGLLGNSGGIGPGSSEGGSYDMVEKEHRQDLDKIFEQKIFGIEVQAERVRKYLVG